MTDDIPFFAIGNDELAKKPEAGKFAPCPHCKKRKKIHYAGENNILGTVTCEGKSYMVALAGKLL